MDVKLPSWTDYAMVELAFKKTKEFKNCIILTTSKIRKSDIEKAMSYYHESQYAYKPEVQWYNPHSLRGHNGFGDDICVIEWCMTESRFHFYEVYFKLHKNIELITSGNDSFLSETLFHNTQKDDDTISNDEFKLICNDCVMLDLIEWVKCTHTKDKMLTTKRKKK